MMKDNVPISSAITSPVEVNPVEAQRLAKNVKTKTNDAFQNLNTETAGTSVLVMIMTFLKDPEKFFASLFGKETKDEEAENAKKWEEFNDSSMLAFFEEIKETFSLTQSNTTPESFNEKFEDADFKKIMEFQKKSGKNYSPESLMILWSNKDSLQIKDGALVIEKKSGELQAIDTKNDKTIAESIISKESLNEGISEFTQNLKTSLTVNFSDIPQEYKDKIPMAMVAFERELQESIDEGNIPEFSKTRILSAIEETYSMPWYAKSIVNEKIDTFLASTEGKNLKTQYKDLWVA